MSQCRACGKHLTNDEIGIYKKLVCRTARDFLCKYCLAAHFHCEVRQIDEKIRQFRESGCFLFPRPAEQPEEPPAAADTVPPGQGK